MTANLLEVRDLTVRFPAGRDGWLTAVERLGFAIRQRETLAIVGESGCGKSVTALALLGLLPGARVSGQALFQGQDLLGLPEREISRLRGRRLAIIFQDPLSALNPVLPVGTQIAESLVRHEGLSWRAARARAVELLALVRIPEPGRRLGDYPHQLSGGMRQRVVIAIALAAGPSLLIADEATTALDVTVQAQILKLLTNLQAELGTALLIISHDLGMVAEIADRVLVMYAGHKVEEQAVGPFFRAPLHPYARDLMAARPAAGRRGEMLREIPGLVPSLAAMASGCAYAPRCGHRIVACDRGAPKLAVLGPGTEIACIRAVAPAVPGRA